MSSEAPIGGAPQHDETFSEPSNSTLIYLAGWFARGAMAVYFQPGPHRRDGRTPRAKMFMRASFRTTRQANLIRLDSFASAKRGIAASQGRLMGTTGASVHHASCP